MPTLAELLALPSAPGLRGGVASDTGQFVILPPGASGAVAFIASTPTVAQGEVDEATAFAIDRNNHVGTQPVSSVTGLSAALDARTMLSFNLINDGGWTATAGSIGSYAFNYGTLTEIYIGSAAAHIGDYAFNGCSSLTSVTIGNSVTSIGDSAFYDCSSLTTITIPDSVTSIGDSAFYDCSSLTSITIGNGVMSIGSYAFNGCSSLTTLNIHVATAPSLGSNAFYNVPAPIDIHVPVGATGYVGGQWDDHTIIDDL